MYTPTWAEHEEKLHKGTPSEQRQALEAFTKERDREISVSKKAKEYEEARRNELAKYKPEFTKKRLAKEEEEKTKMIKELKDGGSFKSDISPMPGFVLVEIERPKEELESGLVLGLTEEVEPTTGWVRGVGNDLVTDKTVIPRPVNGGEHVLFKKFAGLNVTTDGKECRLMQFSDLLAKFND